MATQPYVTSRSHLWRTALVALVVLPALPEILILATSLIAQLHGCSADDKTACVIGPFPSASSIIHVLLRAGFVVGAGFLSGLAPLWLALCYVAITRGWSNLFSRLALGFMVTLIFAFVPYLGPMDSIGQLLGPHCQPNEGGVGSCRLYGENIGGVANGNVYLASQFFIGAFVAFVAFGLYLLFLLIQRISHWKRVMPAVELRTFAHKL
jgi:hypothetical protein